MDFPLPPMGEGLYEVELVRWLVKPGEAVVRGQALLEVLSDKATMEVPAPFAGTITAILGQLGAKIAIGQVVLSYETISNEISSAIPIAIVPTVIPVAVADTARSLAPVAAPSVRHIARQFGIDLAQVRGSGPGGRILHDDLSPLLKPAAEAPPDRPQRGQLQPDRPQRGQLQSPFDLGQPGTRVPLIGLRKKIAEKMVEAKRYIPHYSYIDECDFTELVHLRGQLRSPLAKTGVKLTYLAFVIKAVTRALRDVPIVNSTFDEAKQEITLHDRYHIGVAVAAPSGLIVPVIRDADKRDVSGIAKEIERLSDDCRAGRVKADDLKGGTFTVSSIGSIGGLISTPIIYHPQVAILGLGKLVKRPVYDDHGQLKPADIAYLSFSFDHRIVDGAIGAIFGNAVQRHLQSPALLLLPA